MFPEMKQKDSKFAIKLGVKGTGILEMDQHVLHPFVRIHIIDLKTRKYLAKHDNGNPGVTNLESCNFFKVDPQKNEKTPMNLPTVDFFLPLSTQMYDMRIKGVNFCEWNEEFVINELASNIFKENVVILFEVLEFNPLLIVDDSPLLNSERLYPVAWAYLRPLGTASLHMDRIKL